MKNENEAIEDSAEQDASAEPIPSVLPTIKKLTGGTIMVVLFAFIGLLVIGMLLPAVQQVRGPHRRPPCQNNLRQIALALINYESGRMHFPPAYIADENGKPMHSWRVLILPNLDQMDLYNRYRMDEPWDGPNNSKLHDEVVDIFRCPNSSSGKHCTDYAYITGPGTAFDRDGTVNFGGITDGSSNSILVTEVLGEGFHWMKPQDITVEEFIATTNKDAKSNHEGARNVALFDGSTHALDLNTPPEELKKLALINDGQIVKINDCVVGYHKSLQQLNQPKTP